MPLDEKQKQELLKMIDEQRQAMLMGRSSTKSRRKRNIQKKVQTSYTQSDLGSGIEGSTEETYQENHIYDSLVKDVKQVVRKRSEITLQIKSELRKTFDLNWKLILIVTISLVGAMIIGLIIGYIFSIINIVKYT